MIDFIRADKQGNILGLFLLIIAGIAVGCATKAESQKTETPPKKQVATVQRTPDADIRMTRNPYGEMPPDGDLEYSTPVPSTPKSSNLTKSAFEKIKIGSTLTEVEKIMGERGMLVSTMDVNGRKTQIYKWSNDNFSSYIDVTVENNKVVEKKDKGLK